MARNKYPEETVERILDVSYRLFLEQGYDHTTIQDITNALGMSKGAVYHHFKSKEDILDKISDRYYDGVNWFQDIRNDTSLTGLEKMRKMLSMQLSDVKKLELDNVTMSLLKNPKLVALTMQACIHDAGPLFQTMIEDAVRDGSVQTAYPKELAETFMLLVNIWVGIYTTDRDDFLRKLAFLGEMTAGMGLPIIDDTLMQTAASYFDHVMKRD